MSMNIPADVMDVLQALEEHGIPAYPVGGCVRDYVLGKEPHDFDVAAETTPEELCRAMEDFRTVEVGLSFGTLRVISGESVVEVTCCRCDGTYRDCRRPDSVVYNKKLSDDLARRDFTVNAMAYSEKDGVIDIYGGREDAERRLIRAVGDPETRFREDALRIMRALRFSSVLGFEIEEKTAAAVHSLRFLLKNIAAERIFTELKKMLCGENVLDVLMKYSDVICEIIPEMAPSVGFDQKSVYHIYDVYEHIARTVAAAKPDETLRLTMLLHDIGKPLVYTEEESGIRHYRGHPEKSAEMAETVLRRLKADNATTDKVLFLIRYHDVRPASTEKSVHRYLTKVGCEGAKMLFDVRRADAAAHSEKSFADMAAIDEQEEIVEKLMREGACIKISDLAIGGGEILKLGVTPGPAVGEILAHLLEEVADGAIENDPEMLKNAAREHYFRLKSEKSEK